MSSPGEGSPLNDCCDDVPGPPTKEKILDRLDELLADSGGAYSAEKMPLDHAIRYSIIAANKQTGDSLTVIVNVLAQNVVSRVQYAEETVERLMRPHRRMIRDRIKRQETIITELLDQLARCIAARSGYVQANLADVQAKMLGAQATEEPTPAPDSDTGYESESEAENVGPPSPTALGLKPPDKSASSNVSKPPCTYIDICDKDGWWSWWYYWWAWLVWWWSWFRWYLRAAWACFAARCNLPAQPYTAEGMAYVIQMERNGSAGQTPSGMPAISAQGGQATANLSLSQLQGQTLYAALAAPEILNLVQIASKPDGEEELKKQLGVHFIDLPEPNREFADNPIDLEHYPIEELPEE